MPNTLQKIPVAVISFALFFCLGSVVYLNRVPIIEKMDSWGLFPKNEYFTELYFSDHAEMIALQKKELQSGRPATISFTIHNKEGQDMKYSYTVSFRSEKEITTFFHQNTAYIKNGEFKTIRETVSASSPTPPYRGNVLVTLPDKNQSIHFLIGKN